MKDLKATEKNMDFLPLLPLMEREQKLSDSYCFAYKLIG